MLHIHQSNHVENLASSLVGLLTQKPAHPFVKNVVLVQSPGMSQWLKLYIAEQVGISANIDFPLPSSFIWQLYQRLIEGIPERSYFDKQDMTWKIFNLLSEYKSDTRFDAINSYLDGDETDIKRYQLSEKIADVYDQYLMYRPDWIKSWEEDEDLAEGLVLDGQEWQPVLWRALVEKTRSLNQSPFHRASLHERLLNRLEQTDHIPDLPERIFVFGISAMPAQQLDILQRLAGKIDVVILQFNPCMHYWGDVIDEKQLAKYRARLKGDRSRVCDEDGYQVVGNPLLSSFGKLGRDYLDQLLDLEGNFSDAFIEQPDTTILAAIQQDILNLEFRGQTEPLSPLTQLTDQGKRVIRADDNSLHVAVCHSPLREIEVLHDYLLTLFAQDDQLTPRDVVVMLPNVADYTPYIDAVFNSADGEKYIPYGIADHGIAQESPILNSFIALISLTESRFTATDIVSLMDVPAIHRALGLSEADIEQISLWLNQVGIRWGISGDHKASFSLPSVDLNTWSFGLKRFLTGYSLGDEDTLYDQSLAFEGIEGQAAEVCGKLIHFVHRLIHWRDVLAEEATLHDKVRHSLLLVEEMYQAEDDEAWALQQLRDMLTAIEGQQQRENMTGQVNQQVFIYLVQQSLQQKGVGQRFLAGKVNICTLMPMRSIPFKVICIPGMNDADYPRFIAPTGFDLMAKSLPRKGDRSRRLDDRYLFLEAMLAARQHLYLSYTGRSMQDNSVKNPSIVVSELLEYCEQAFMFEDRTDILSAIAVEHPLQPFNPAYYQVESPVMTWQSHWLTYLSITEQASQEQTTDPIVVEVSDVVELVDLVRFFRHPVRYFYQQTLQTRMSLPLEPEQDDESFTSLGLEKLQIATELVDLIQDNPQLHQHELRQMLDAKGLLPHGQPGRLAFEKMDTEARDFIARLSRWTNQATDPQEVNVQVDVNKQAITVQGWLHHRTSFGQLFFRPAKVKPADLLMPWIEHVCWCAMGGETLQHLEKQATETVIVGIDKTVIFNSLAQDDAKQLLGVLLTIYQQGLTQPVPFFIRSSFAWAEKQDMKKALSAFLPDAFRGFPGEGDDLYISRHFTDLAAVEEPFQQLAVTVFEPMLNNMTEEK